MRSKLLVSLLAISTLMVVGCDSETDTVVAPPTGVDPPPSGVDGGMMEPDDPPSGMMAGMGAGTMAGMMAGMTVDIGGMGGTPPNPSTDCDAYSYRNETYNCSEFDRCGDDPDPVVASICAKCYSELDPPNPGWATQPCNNAETLCEDGEDNDGDTYVDCADQDCPNYPCPPIDDGIDCSAPGACQEYPACNADPACRVAVESCMSCHNYATTGNDYSGSGITNPHPFGSASQIRCTQCHGGNGQANGKGQAHVPPPPQIGDRQYQVINAEAAFNRITLAGMDRFGPYPSNGAGNCPDDTCTGLDYLQFVNPGDLRVVAVNKGCGGQACHAGEHAEWVPRSTIGTTNGFFAGTRFMTGQASTEAKNEQYRNEGYALSDTAPRPVSNPNYNPNDREIGEVGSLSAQQEYAQFNGPMYNNNNYLAANLNNDQQDENVGTLETGERIGRVNNGSNLSRLIDEQVMITCGNCHLYSAGDNNRYADFRSSGCSACHMQYSMDGRSRSSDRNVNKLEPANPDQIAPGERAHISDHIIRNVSKVSNGIIVRGITDEACVGCHQGSNRTVLQYWGIRLDQNADLANNLQYPANPQNFTNTADDPRIFDQAVQNNTFNGRNANQYILIEDYDDDGLDDTPPDVHYEAQLGCIDCHGSRDLHGGVAGDPTSGKIQSRQDQGTKITCESCHGTIEAYAQYSDCRDYLDQPQTCATDKNGNALRNVTRDPQGNFWLRSRIFGEVHYVPQTYDLVSQNNKTHPITGNLLYSPKANFAMGRITGVAGYGPIQANLTPTIGFSHTDNLDCVSCHASWTNNCIGCHLKNQYDVNPNNNFFSNITGEKILLFEDSADFVYQSPIPTYLGINSKGYITQIDPAEKMFYRYEDLNGDLSDVFAFSDYLGFGNNPGNPGANPFPALAMNQMSPHSVRGRLKPTDNAEGLRYCVACHNTVEGWAEYGANYVAFVDAYTAAIANNNFADINFNELQVQIGQNTSNDLNSPFFVHMVAGLGTALFLFDANGCPVNPLDARADRADPADGNEDGICNNQSPADNFANLAQNVAYDLDRIVEATGVSNAASIHPMIQQRGPYRDGNNRMMSGPLNADLINRLTNPDPAQQGILLDTYLDSNGILITP